MTRPAPKSQSDTEDQNETPVRQNAKSQTKAATKNAIGNGISIGCNGWPAIEAVLFGLGVVGLVIREPPPPEKRVSLAMNAELVRKFLPKLAMAGAPDGLVLCSAVRDPSRPG
jgi:hypothetical protein